MNDLNDHALIDLPEARRFVYRNENDASRDDILTDAINDTSDSIWDYCEREFKDTTVSDRSGADGVGSGTTTFTSATAAFTANDVGKRIRIGGAYFTIASFTNGTTVVLDRVVATATSLAWDFGEMRTIPMWPSGYVDLRPYDLHELATATLYADRADLTDDVLAVDELQMLRQAGGTAYDLRVMKPEFSPAHDSFVATIAIRGWWGMRVIPGAVQLACKQWVKNIAENPGSYASSSMSGYDVVPEMDTVVLAPAGMPAAVRYRLDRFARGEQPIR